jgi:hypothetical protein
MLKTIITFALGIAVGAGGMWYGPGNIQNHAVEATNKVVLGAESFSFDRCAAKFYSESTCVETKGRLQCLQELQSACGTREEVE